MNIFFYRILGLFIDVCVYWFESLLYAQYRFISSHDADEVDI